MVLLPALALFPSISVYLPWDPFNCFVHAFAFVESKVEMRLMNPNSFQRACLPIRIVPREHSELNNLGFHQKISFLALRTLIGPLPRSFNQDIASIQSNINHMY